MAETKEPIRRYIIMDTGPLVANDTGPSLADASFSVAPAGVELEARAEAVELPKMKVIGSIDATGPKLVEMPAEGELSLRLSMPGIKIVPEVFYEMQRVQFSADLQPRPQRHAKLAANEPAAAPAANGGNSASITVTDGVSGAPIAGAKVVAFTKFATRTGYNGQTGPDGVVTINKLDPARTLERLYVYPPAGYWGAYRPDTTAAASAQIKLDPIDLKSQFLLLAQLYGQLPADAGKGVTIAVIDSGVDGKHPDLAANVTGGQNCVSDELTADPTAIDQWTPAANHGEHGTHVAGIAAGRGTTSGFRGVAPGASIRSYRVFPHDKPTASNFDIIRAIRAAVAEGCHIINMSLGGGPRDDAVRIEIDRALAAGVTVVVAAGNDGRKPVSMPAALPGCVAVSAMGREKSFPITSNGMSTILDPKGVPTVTDFVADFSNIGPEIDVIGPGVEIVSTLPGKGYGAMNGTSMATPAVAGFAAYLLAANPAVMQKVGADRSRALKDLLYASCKPQGFGREFEGFGLPLPPGAAAGALVAVAAPVAMPSPAATV